MSNFFFSLPSFFPFNACNKEDNSSLFTLAKIAKLSKKIDSYLCCFFYSTAAISLFFPAFTAVAVISGVALIVLTVACEIFEQRKKNYYHLNSFHSFSYSVSTYFKSF